MSAMKFNYIAINNSLHESLILEKASVSQIMVDTEIIGKVDRQFGKKTVINNHQIEDVILLKENLNVPIICRINPYNQNTNDEIKRALNAKADCIMIPMITNMEHFKKMVDLIEGKAQVIPLIETPYSFFKLDEILNFSDFKQIHFGLNDLFIALGMRNLFEILLSNTFKAGVDFAKNKVDVLGVGGVGFPNENQKVNPLLIFNHLNQLGANSVILSRSFFEQGYEVNNIKYGLNKLEDSLQSFEYSKELFVKQIESFLI